MSKGLFFDTYALIELSKRNTNYEGYQENVRMFITKLNILEFSYYLLRVERGENIVKMFEELDKYCVDYDDDILARAAEMKFEHKKERLSFIDCIGYLLAKKHKVKFLRVM